MWLQHAFYVVCMSAGGAVKPTSLNRSNSEGYIHLAGGGGVNRSAEVCSLWIWLHVACVSAADSFADIECVAVCER